MPLKYHVDGVAQPSDWWGLVVLHSSTNPRIMSSSCAGVSHSAFLRHSLLSVLNHLSNALDAIMCRVGAGRQAEGPGHPAPST